MGFLNVFGKKEAKPKQEVDIPPPPPLPSMPSVKGKKGKEIELPPLPPLEPITLKHEKHKPREVHEMPKPPGPPAFEQTPEFEAPRFPPPGIKPRAGKLQMHPRQGFKIPEAFKKQAAPRHAPPPRHMPPPPRQMPPPPRHREASPFVPPVRTREEEMIKKDIKGPLFVKQDSYKAILEGVSIIRNKLKESDDLVLNLNNIKNSKDKEFEKWRASLEDIQRKLIYVDKALYEK
ncbi:hypothetical protein CMO89_01090 [Candidatus Woesearchaeota archaeon]|nr:hypothetical protein [Candidatus Woesearchaeota archaeon]|tara:strand:- start:195 stop:893 length:699 start_codon:yes stop_codon:yes gene_type:complete